ncbi:hypothetical protein PISMIDRAFT_17565 [Pisolithus microcarpus 441]|uniref:Protein transport protein SEC23 n=1 Tax=Pisolithus microcarpus 441 TaxID=765257 RepID=A0A0C9YV79_9AGAM|nr:hypothetical protein BKA83DRAFT_17565 [Pisolithus microcarpus]KIK14057.1 hypothetical protein PISMIDRAFT_17565 [Pisolithus microcarpus 441]
MHTQNVSVQAENVSTEDEGGQVGEEEEEEEHVEGDEAKLVLEVARAQHKICCIKQQLSTARLKEIDGLGNLYRFRAEDAERKLQYADFDLGHTPSCPALVPPIFVFVVDTCLDEEDLKVLHKATTVSLGYIPPYALIRLITLGTMIQVHKPGYAEHSKSYVFHGGKEYASEQIQDMLGLSTPAHAAPHPGLLMPQQALSTA